MSLIGPLLRFLWRWYVERLVCLHFCRFRQAGSDLKYTHVHVLPTNPRRATGLGHDDHTGNDNAGHTTVSTNGDCRIQAEDEASMALRELGYLATAYFHQANAEGPCPEGYRSVRCTCGEQAVGVCYTLDYHAFDRWYREQRWDNRRGRYELPFVTVNGEDEKGIRLKCGSSVLLYRLEIKVVPSCDGFGGPADGENALVQDARRALQSAADATVCEAGCTKRTAEVFCGWRCFRDRGGALFAEAGLQWRVTCE